MTFPIIIWKCPKSHVPNHQPDIVDPHLQTKIETAWNCWVFGFISSYLILRNSARLHRVRISSSARVLNQTWSPKKHVWKTTACPIGGSRSPTLPGEYWTNPTHPTCDHEWRWHRQQIANSCCHRSWDGYILRPTESSWVVASVNVISLILANLSYTFCNLSLPCSWNNEFSMSFSEMGDPMGPPSPTGLEHHVPSSDCNCVGIRYTAHVHPFSNTPITHDVHTFPGAILFDN